jgi:hypothetical protein
VLALCLTDDEKRKLAGWPEGPALLAKAESLAASDQILDRRP